MDTEEVEILDAYRHLMVEAEDRLNLAMQALDGQLPIGERAIREYCYLQLRFVCECIAIACVIAHDGLSDLNLGGVKEAYQADKMVNALGKLHDRFYPHPMLITEVSEGQKQLSDRPCDFLEKEDLKKLYRECGEILHRGTPANFTAGLNVQTGWQDIVRGHVMKVINLLASHATVMKGDEKVIFYDGINNQAVAAHAVLDIEKEP